MQQRQKPQTRERLFTASEVAEFEYCPLVWWHEQFEPMAQADTDEQFARLVELEQEHGAQAPALPEYQVIEQLLLRKGAFEEGRQQHIEHAEEVEEAQHVPARMITTGRTRILFTMIMVILVIALLLIAASLLLR
jgi:hypothetical protein